MTDNQSRLLKNLWLLTKAFYSEGRQDDPISPIERHRLGLRDMRKAKRDCRRAKIPKKLIDSTIDEARTDAYVESLNFYDP